MSWKLQTSSDEIALLMEVGFLCRYSRHFAEARDIFTGVQVLRPDSEIPLVALGSVDFEEGHFAKAIEGYRKALRVNPNSAYAYAHLGEAQLFQLDKESAHISLQRAISLDPKGESGKFARSLLAFAEVVSW